MDTTCLHLLLKIPGLKLRIKSSYYSRPSLAKTLQIFLIFIASVSSALTAQCPQVLLLLLQSTEIISAKTVVLYPKDTVHYFPCLNSQHHYTQLIPLFCLKHSLFLFFVALCIPCFLYTSMVAFSVSLHVLGLPCLQ